MTSSGRTASCNADQGIAARMTRDLPSIGIGIAIRAWSAPDDTHRIEERDLAPDHPALERSLASRSGIPPMAAIRSSIETLQIRAGVLTRSATTTLAESARQSCTVGHCVKCEQVIA